MALTYQQLLTAVPLVLRAGNVPNIVGDAGIGKSALVEDVARQMSAQLYTTVVSLSEKGDLAIPVPPLTSDSFVETKDYGRLANVQYGYAETLIRIIQFAEEHPGQPIIWFLDEFNRGSQAVQSELMNLVLQRRINSLRLPAQVKMIIAENPDSTMAGFNDREYDVAVGDAAINDRTVRLVMATSTTEWLEWARHRQPAINALVIKYLDSHPDRLMMVANSPESDLEPTPRAWERVSTNLDELQKLPRETQEQLAGDLFSGDLGATVGESFAQFFLAQGSELTLEVVQTTADGQRQFKTADEAVKVELLREWLNQPDDYSLDTDQGAAVFLKLLRSISADGQVAVAKSVGESGLPLVTAMYRQATSAPAGAVAGLYQELARAASQGERRG
ncbi:AAA family ATPase [Limosilactobacillus oris]|uniref:AAA family ATPase n=1 Tax=Limosilactobacillus oris TaxID=1632 RepID=UPI00388DF88B